MAISLRYADFAAGNDYAGASFTDGAFTVADMTLTKTGAFTASKANHWLYLTDNGSGNVTVGYYKIASVTSANTVVLATSPKSGATDPTDVKCTQATGTTALPFRSVQGALDLIARDATNGDQVNVKAGTAQALVASIVLTTYGTPTRTAPLVIRGYTSAANDGGIGDIDGGGSYAVYATATNYISFIDMHLHNSGGRTLLTLGHYGVLARCEIDNNTGDFYLVSLNLMTVVGCYFHNSKYFVRANASGMYLGNYFKDDAGTVVQAVNGFSADTYVIGNIFDLNTAGATAIIDGGGNGVFIGNTIRNNAAGTGAGIKLIYYTRVIANNIIEGFSGTGGDAIDFNSKLLDVYLSNAFYNNTNNETSVLVNLFTDDNHDALGGSAFVNGGGGDFDINGTVTGVTEDAYPTAFKGLANTTPKQDKGASQAGAPAATLVLEAGGGTYHAPDQGEVLDSAVYGASSGTAGTYHAPSVGEVIDTAVFGVSSGTSGTFAVPAEADVELGVGYGAGGTEFEGTLEAGEGGGGGGPIIGSRIIRGLGAI